MRNGVAIDDIFKTVLTSTDIESDDDVLITGKYYDAYGKEMLAVCVSDEQKYNIIFTISGEDCSNYTIEQTTGRIEKRNIELIISGNFVYDNNFITIDSSNLIDVNSKLLSGHTLYGSIVTLVKDANSYAFDLTTVNLDNLKVKDATGNVTQNYNFVPTNNFVINKKE